MSDNVHLKIDHLKLFQLKYIDGLTDKECSEKLKCSTKTIQRARNSKTFLQLEHDLQKELLNRIYFMQHNIIDALQSLIVELGNLSFDDKLRALTVISKFSNFSVTL